MNNDEYKCANIIYEQLWAEIKEDRKSLPIAMTVQ